VACIAHSSDANASTILVLLTGVEMHGGDELTEGLFRQWAVRRVFLRTTRFVRSGQFVTRLWRFCRRNSKSFIRWICWLLRCLAKGPSGVLRKRWR